MSADNILDKVKQLRELTGVGFKDCKTAIDESNGDIEKSVEYLRKKGIAKASKKMQRVAAEGLVCVHEENNKYSIIEVNSETDFVAKNDEFINFVEKLSRIAHLSLGKLETILNAEMKKITIRRSDFVGDENLINFSYVHSAFKKNVGKIGVLVSLKSNKKKNDLIEFGKQLSMHIAALSPIAIDKSALDEQVVKKEKEIIVEEIKNSVGKVYETGCHKIFNEDVELPNTDWVNNNHWCVPLYYKGEKI